MIINLMMSVFWTQQIDVLVKCQKLFILPSPFLIIGGNPKMSVQSKFLENASNLMISIFFDGRREVGFILFFM